jgi:hypothetical protein
MISFDLTAEEKETLIEILECVLADIHMEMQRTEGRGFRRLMQYRAGVIEKVVTSLEEGQQVGNQESLTDRTVLRTSDGKKQGA